jgi:hypothetical protein
MKRSLLHVSLFHGLLPLQPDILFPLYLSIFLFHIPLPLFPSHYSPSLQLIIEDDFRVHRIVAPLVSETKEVVEIDEVEDGGAVE